MRKTPLKYNTEQNSKYTDLSASLIKSCEDGSSKIKSPQTKKNRTSEKLASVHKFKYHTT